MDGRMNPLMVRQEIGILFFEIILVFVMVPSS